ncbi:MAG: RnfABCDGE type electron transport complex subunit G [Elusimicrobia bacterium]|nr:RnfABCDGE type electron transport complex subunit G [Elusimicrobiota bacterium]
MKETIKLGSYLFIVCAVAGIALSATNYFTSQKIERQKKDIINNALKEVLPLAEKTRQKDSFVEGFDSENNLIGYVLKTDAAGYSSQIEILVGIDNDFNITGIKILSQAETPGLGSKITENDFLSQFVGLQPDKVLLKNDGGKIDAITSATISSRAVTDAVKKRIDEFKNNPPRRK